MRLASTAQINIVYLFLTPFQTKIPRCQIYSKSIRHNSLAIFFLSAGNYYLCALKPQSLDGTSSPLHCGDC